MGQTSTGTVRMSAAVAILAVLGLVLSLFTMVLPVLATPPAATHGKIAIFKTMCQEIGQQDTCVTGRDTSLNNYMIDFQVFAGTATSGIQVTPELIVTLSENANGDGNTGNGSQGRIESADLPIGQYTVCEVPVAYLGTDRVPLDPEPRPIAGNGGSTGGQQVQTGDNCITVTVTAGTAELKFLNLRVPQTPTLTLDKITVNGDSSFAFSATGGFNQSLTGAGAPLLVSSSAGAFTITETVSAAQATAGWAFTSVDCTGNAAAETPGGTGVAVTVGANEDVICTFTNTRTGSATLGGNPTPTPTPTPVVRAGTLAASVPNTAIDAPMNQLPVVFLALLTLGSLGYLGRRNLIGIRNRR